MFQLVVFRLFYRRLAPRLNVFHEIKASFLPISVVYDEDALDGLASLFNTDTAFFAERPAARQTDELVEEAASEEFVQDTQLFFTVNVPEVLLELRTKRKSPTAEVLCDATSAPFASARVTKLSVGIARTERFLTRMKVGFDQFCLKDLFEKTEWPLLRTIPPPETSTLVASVSV